jgi:hypothetical protein
MRCDAGAKMKIIELSYEIRWPPSPFIAESMLHLIEESARVCYKSSTTWGL